MRWLTKIGMIVFVGLIVLNMITYKSCKSYKEKYDQAVLEKENLLSKFDSILALPPDTIKLPPEIIKSDSLVYVTRWINDLNKAEISAQTYRDSIINDSIDLRVKIKANQLFSIDYAYKPIFKYQEKIVNKNIPYPVEVIKDVKVNSAGLFFNAGLGYAKENNVAGKLGLLYLTKKQSIVAYDFVRVDKMNVHILSYGIKF